MTQVYETKPDPKRPWKAYVAGAIAAVSAGVAWWVADEDPFTAKDFGQAVLAAIGAGAPTWLGTYFTTNPRVVDFKE